jgi:histone-lysine N-methyltransferase SETD2
LAQKRKDLQAQLSSLNPIKENTKLEQISRVLDGSAAIVDIKKPKTNPKSRAKPKPQASSKKRKLEDPSPPSRTLSQLTGSSSQSITILNPQQTSQPPKKKFRPIRTANILKHLPDFIQPHVEKIENVKADGHCGFRAAAFCLGKGEGSFLNIRTQLDDEITKRKDFYLKIGCFENSKQCENALARIKTNSAAPVGEEHWMSMPMTAEPLANAFSTPVFYFSTTGSQGFFPHFTPANNNPPIFIAFIPESSHFVALTLKDPLNFPFPYPVGLNNWRKHVDRKALDWEQKYSSCIKLGQDE